MSDLGGPRENVSVSVCIILTSVTTKLSCSESLPDEDPETQAVLLQRVLEILIEVENLTPAEKTLVQNNLTSITIGSFVGTESGQPWYAFTSQADSSNADNAISALDPTPESESFSELSTLVRLRFKHQSEEEASSVRVARTGDSQELGKVAGSDPNACDKSPTASFLYSHWQQLHRTQSGNNLQRKSTR